MLQTYLDDQEWDLTAFVDLIEDDDDEGLFALVTALNLYRYRVKDFLLHKCRGPRKMRLDVTTCFCLTARKGFCLFRA